MEYGKPLIRMAMRSFYETKSILVIDALMVHSALRDDDLAYVLGMQTKELRKLCGKLREDRFVAEAARQETREGLQRPITRTYYYIDFQLTLDAIKLRIYKLTKLIEGKSTPSSERKDFYCPQCHSKWSTLEAIDNVDPATGMFLCHRCNHPLREDTEARKSGVVHEAQSRLMLQLDPMLKLLQRIDNVYVPASDIDSALAVAVPVQRNNLTNPQQATHALHDASKPSAVRGLAQQTPQISVSLIDPSNANSQATAEAVAAADRRRAVALQNALPVWHTNSTVTGDQTALGAAADAVRNELDVQAALRAETEEEERKKKPALEAAKEAEELAEYYAALEREKAEAERKEREEEDEEDDDDDGEEDEEDEEDEDGFEDVDSGAAGDTVSARTATAERRNGTVLKSSTTSGVVKMLRTDTQGSERSMHSASSTTGSSSANTPASSTAAALGAGMKRSVDGLDSTSEAKKVRIVSVTEIETKQVDSEEDEDDVEFEDV